MRRLRADRVAVAAALLVAAPARADDLAASRTYFAGERAQGAAWGAVGAVGIATGAVALARGDDLARGAAYPLLAVGAIQVGAAVFSYIGPPRRLRRAETARDPAAWRQAEHARMKRVVVAFTALETAEISLVAVGTGLVLAGKERGSDTMIGIGGGIAFEALAMLALDGAAHARADRYLERLSIGVTGQSARIAWTTTF